MQINSFFRKLYLNLFFRTKFIANFIFKTRFIERDKDAYYFDITTYYIIKVLLLNLNSKNKFLDLGTGTSALIAIEIKKRVGCKVIASDINKEIIKLAKLNIKFNKEKIYVYKSNFFKNIKSDFNVISFNPPYVSSSLGKKISLSEKFRSQWDGGNKSDQVITNFIKNLYKLKKSPICYMGINSQHLGAKHIKKLVKMHTRLKILKIYKSSMFPVNVYVIKKF